MMPYIQKVRASPTEFISGRNVRTTTKLNAMLATVQMLMARPRIFSGRISETTIQPMGPSEKAKEAIYTTTLPTAIHLRLSPSASANQKEAPSANRLTVTPLKPA